MDQISRFKKLLQPGRIGQLELRNRIVMAPMGDNFPAEDGSVTERQKNFYEERARGGAGIIIIGTAAVELTAGRLMPRQISISDDIFIPGLNSLAQAVHRHGAKVSIQLNHGGRIRSAGVTGCKQAVAPSAIPYPGGEVPRELALEEIPQIINYYAQAGLRAKKAEFDGVEIHAAHGYLISQFLSRAANKRKDIYGGELKNRARFLLETIKAVKETVGPAYPVWCRLDGKWFGIEEGIIPEEAQEVARMIEGAGADAIHVSGYGGGSDFHFTEAPLVYEPGYLVPLAEGIKRVVGIPVMAVGRIGPELGEKILRQDKADFITMGRSLIADPELPNKLKSGKIEDIKPCICCYTCTDAIFVGNGLSCAVNAAAGRESEFKFEPSSKSKRVLIVGSGPAGMEAARMAASRGHKVLLYEKMHRLGGSLFYASLVRQENENITSYLAKQIRNLSVEIKLGEEVTPGTIDYIRPDVIILASGANYIYPEIPGADRNNVITGVELRQIVGGRTGNGMKTLTRWERGFLYISGPLLRRYLKPSTLRWLTKRWIPFGKRITLIGGDLAGCELAEFLAKRGRMVTILENEKRVAAEMSIALRWKLLHDLEQNKVNILTRVKYEEIIPEGVVITDREGKKRTIESDTIVLVGSVRPNEDIFRTIQGKTSEIYQIGDCVGLRMIKGAIADGAGVALKI